jgi:hypothetical protein
MIIHLVITSIVILLHAFDLNLARAAYLIGEEIAGPDGARNIQNAVTPPLAGTLGLILQLAFIGCLVAVFFVHGWLLGFLSIPVSFLILGIAAKVLMPAPESEFFRGMILRSLMNRYADYRKGGDIVRAQAVDDLLERMGYPIPETLS